MTRATRTTPIAAVISGLTLLCSWGAPALAQEAPVTGTVYKVPRSANAYVSLKGAGALQMYKEMAGKPRPDLCRGEGRMLKVAGNIACSIAKDGNSAVCDFGLNLKKGSASVGQPC
jgi:hypothetical protein